MPNITDLIEHAEVEVLRAKRAAESGDAEAIEAHRAAGRTLAELRFEAEYDALVDVWAWCRHSVARDGSVSPVCETHDVDHPAHADATLQALYRGDDRGLAIAILSRAGVKVPPGMANPRKTVF